MKNLSGMIVGIVLSIFGAFLVLAAIFDVDDRIGTGVMIIYGIISISLGAYILSHLDKEDEVEQIKKRKRDKKSGRHK